MKKLTAILLIAMLVMAFAVPVLAADELSPERTIEVVDSAKDIPDPTEETPYFIFDADTGVTYAKFKKPDGSLVYIPEDDIPGNTKYSGFVKGDQDLYEGKGKFVLGSDATTTDSDGNEVKVGKGEFVALIVDGKIVDDAFYQIADGTSEFTLTEEFMKTLMNGKHTFTIQYTDGSATSVFYVGEKPADADTVEYQVIKGSEEKWTKNSGEDFIVASDHVSNIGKDQKEPVVQHFTELVIDGKTVDPSNYTVYEGSIEIKLKASFMESLELGAHPFTINADDGSASAKFYVVTNDTAAAQPGTSTNTPAQTGDDSNTSMWTAIALIALGAIGVVALTLVKTRKSTEK